MMVEQMTVGHGSEGRNSATTPFAQGATAPLAQGATAPFTSPALMGARLRLADDRAGGLRLTVTPPGCDAGVPWRAIAATERVTLHDRLMLRLLEASPGPITPRAVAIAAQEIAISGAAGKAAQKAASINAQEEEEDRLIAQFLLVVNLLEATGVEGCDWRHLSPSDPAFDRWMAQSVTQLAPILAKAPPHEDGAVQLAQWLERLSALIAPIGLPADEYKPRARRALDDLATFRADIAVFAAAQPQPRAAQAHSLALSADQILTRAETIVAACDAAFSDLRRLHDDWPSIGPQIADYCLELDFLLDGWPAACLAWREAAISGHAAQRAALQEAALLVGVTPDAAPPRLAEPILIDKIYRNELLRASAP